VVGNREDGFSIVEVLVSIVLLSIGALALAGIVAQSARRLSGSQDQLIASQRAAEAAESAFKARDTRVLAWDQIRNVSDGGVFLNGPQQVRDAGADGLVNTADDGPPIEVVRPGPDGLLGTPDDERVPLFGFTREIVIRDLGPSLRELEVVVTFRTANGSQRFVLTTYISAYA
jgi:prepilin-type N-terminal cleavage/methylation domain-containing protein